MSPYWRHIGLRLRHVTLEALDCLGGSSSNCRRWPCNDNDRASDRNVSQDSHRLDHHLSARPHGDRFPMKDQLCMADQIALGDEHFAVATPRERKDYVKKMQEKTAAREATAQMASG